MTVEDAKKIRQIGLKSIENKRELKKFAQEKGYSDAEVVRVVHARTADQILALLKDNP